MDADDAASVKVVHDIAAAHPKTGVYVMADTVVHDGEDADGIDRRRIKRGDIRVLDDAFFADHALVRTRDAVIDRSFICYAAAAVNFDHAFALGRGGRLADQILHAVDLLQKGFVGKILVDEPAAMEQIVIFLRETALVPQRLGGLGIVVVFEDQGLQRPSASGMSSAPPACVRRAGICNSP